MTHHHHKVVLVAGASLTAVVFVGVLLYLWKRSHDNDDETGQEKDELEFADLNVREEESVASAGQTIVNVKVPQHVVGIIIGKDGSNIKQLRAEFGVRFNFNRDELPENTLGNENKRADRVLEIRGQRDKVRLAEYKVNAIIAETPKYVETEVFVPADTCGRIIGKGGQNIREMCSTSGAKIVLEREENKLLGNQRRIALSGTTVQIEYAKLLIKEKVEQAKADTYKYGKKGDDFKSNDFRHVTLPSTGEYFQVFVSSSQAPNDFWVQLVSKESTNLDVMTDELAEVYGKLKPEEERLECGNVGDICIAPFEGGMYRAAIRKINQDRTAELFYLDFGDVSCVTLDDIKVIRPEYKELYGQAVHCQLPIKPAGDAWTDEACAEFEDLTYCARWKPLMSKVLYHVTNPEGEIYVLQLVDTTQNEDVDITATMVSKGHALEVQGFVTKDSLLENGTTETETTLTTRGNSDVTSGNKELSTVIVNEAEIESVESIILESGLEYSFYDDTNSDSQIGTEFDTHVDSNNAITGVQPEAANEILPVDILSIERSILEDIKTTPTTQGVSDVVNPENKELSRDIVSEAEIESVESTILENGLEYSFDDDTNLDSQISREVVTPIDSNNDITLDMHFEAANKISSVDMLPMERSTLYDTKTISTIQGISNVVTPKNKELSTDVVSEKEIETVESTILESGLEYAFDDDTNLDSQINTEVNTPIDSNNAITLGMQSEVANKISPIDISSVERNILEDTTIAEVEESVPTNYLTEEFNDPSIPLDDITDQYIDKPRDIIKCDEHDAATAGTTKIEIKEQNEGFVGEGETLRRVDIYEEEIHPETYNGLHSEVPLISEGSEDNEADTTLIPNEAEEENVGDVYLVSSDYLHNVSNEDNDIVSEPIVYADEVAEVEAVNDLLFGDLNGSCEEISVVDDVEPISIIDIPEIPEIPAKFSENDGNNNITVDDIDNLSNNYSTANQIHVSKRTCIDDIISQVINENITETVNDETITETENNESATTHIVNSETPNDKAANAVEFGFPTTKVISDIGSPIEIMPIDKSSDYIPFLKSEAISDTHGRSSVDTKLPIAQRDISDDEMEVATTKSVERTHFKNNRKTEENVDNKTKLIATENSTSKEVVHAIEGDTDTISQSTEMAQGDMNTALEDTKTATQEASSTSSDTRTTSQNTKTASDVSTKNRRLSSRSKRNSTSSRNDVEDYVEIDIKKEGENLIVNEHKLDSTGENVSDIENIDEHSNEFEPQDELQRSLDETSRKNVRHRNSMEFARENLLNVDESDDDSFFSAKSDITITSDKSQTQADTDADGAGYFTVDADSGSYFTADSRAISPSNTNDSFFSLPSPRGSRLSLTSSIGSPDRQVSPIPSRGSKLSLTSSIGSPERQVSYESVSIPSIPTFEINFIDEKSNTLLSSQSVPTFKEATLNGNVGENMGRETAV